MAAFGGTPTEDASADEDADADDPEGADGPFGPGSAAPAADGSGPDGWVKGNADTMIFHSTASPAYDSTEAEVYFHDETTAAAAGFRHWDPSQR
ncbi:hypothetical protein GCM10027572_00040 [Flexivirga lutea]